MSVNLGIFLRSQEHDLAERIVELHAARHPFNRVSAQDVASTILEAERRLLA